MRLFPVALALFVVGCGGKDKDKDPTGDSGTPTGGPQLAITCTEKAIELRYECVVETPVDEAVTLNWGPVDTPGEFTATSPGGTLHSFPVWGLRPQVLHEIVATSDSGTGVTGITPRALPTNWQANWTVTGESTGDATLVPLGCAGAPTVVLLDKLGRPMAYQQFEGQVLNGFDFTPEGNFLGMVNQRIVGETNLLGQIQMRVEAGPTSFEGPTHHEVHRGASGITWILSARQYMDGPTAYVADVVFGIDSTGQQVAEWEVWPELAQPLDDSLTNLYTYWNGAFPGAIDYTHGNGIFEHDGDLYLSFRRIDSVWKIEGDPTAPNFGEVLWKLAPDTSDEGSDLTITSSNGSSTLLDFDGQHTATITPDGLLGIYDNRRTAGPMTRAIFFDIDEGAGTADIVEDYRLGRTCMNQGSVYSRTDGRRLATCPETATAYEFEQGGTDPVWTLQAQCGAPMFRAIPVDLPDVSPF